MPPASRQTNAKSHDQETRWPSSSEAECFKIHDKIKIPSASVKGE